jgi:hypothetical protein
MLSIFFQDFAVDLFFRILWLVLGFQRHRKCGGRLETQDRKPGLSLGARAGKFGAKDELLVPIETFK